MTDNSTAFASCRFYVQINGIARAVFTEVSGLQVEIDTMSYEEGGNNGFVHSLPGRAKIGNVTLKRGMVASNEFFSWCYSIAQGNIDRRSLSIIMYDASGKQLLRWELINAFPVKWSGPQFSADGTVAAVESLEIAHGGLKAENGASQGPVQATGSLSTPFGTTPLDQILEGSAPDTPFGSTSLNQILE